jgi:hypothetical protein
MNINIIYRPLAATLKVWDNSLAGDDWENISYVSDTDDDEWNYLVGSLGDRWATFTALGLNDKCSDWNLWLACYLPDETVSEIVNLVSGWEAESVGSTLEQRVMTVHKAVVTI